ncbi:MAG: 4Fe-4S binding protein [Endomicrobiales bacterium]|nr:4Fe-4S binding protein [Endomicrobiales bacterium]
MIKPGAMLREVLRHMAKKPATEQYPFVKKEKPPKFRGKLVFYAEKCIGCNMCVRDCPANAIKITKKGDKQFECEIMMNRCIFCAQCVDSCPRKALEATKEFELAQLDPKKFKVVYEAAAPKPVENTEKKPE